MFFQIITGVCWTFYSVITSMFAIIAGVYTYTILFLPRAIRNFVWSTSEYRGVSCFAGLFGVCLVFTSPAFFAYFYHLPFRGYFTYWSISIILLSTAILMTWACFWGRKLADPEVKEILFFTWVPGITLSLLA